MILVDTSVWIEFLKAKEPVFTEMKEILESGNVVTHSLIFAELLQGCKSKKEADIVMNYWAAVSDSQSNFGIIEGGLLSYQKKFFSKGVGLIDSVLISECRRRSLKLWSLDKRLLSLLSKHEIFSI